MNQITLLNNRNFLFHWLGVIISQTGGFFTFVALPWLVLSITNNNPFIMSTVMATSSLPQVFFMLFGGVLADKFSPLKTLLIGRSLFVLVLASLALLVYMNYLPLLMLYIYAFVLGTLGAITIPASQSLLPGIVDGRYLATANGLIMGSGQVSQILGSILAGWLIWIIKVFREVPESQFDNVAIAIAFAIDASAVCIAIVLMIFIKTNFISAVKEKFWVLFKQGITFCWKDKGIAFVLAYLILVSLFLHGVLMAGLPVFTKLHLGLSERAYGSLYAMMGVGTIIGIGLGVILRPPEKHLGILVLVCDLLNGMALFFLGAAIKMASASLYLLLMGVCAGIVMVAGTTWFQQRTPDELMGRVMSILMFCILGLIPVSASITGILMLHYPITLIMGYAGATILVIAFIGLLIPRVRKMGYVSSPEVGDYNDKDVANYS